MQCTDTGTRISSLSNWPCLQIEIFPGLCLAQRLRFSRVDEDLIRKGVFSCFSQNLKAIETSLIRFDCKSIKDGIFDDIKLKHPSFNAILFHLITSRKSEEDERK